MDAVTRSVETAVDQVTVARLTILWVRSCCRITMIIVIAGVADPEMSSDTWKLKAPTNNLQIT